LTISHAESKIPVVDDTYSVKDLISENYLKILMYMSEEEIELPM